MSVITTHGLTKRYGRRTGIEDVSLDVSEGVVFGFLGPNGAGKTTAIRVLLGFLRASVGTAEVFGMDCWRHNAAIKRDVGYLPGDLRLYPWLTGRSALRIAGRARRRDLRRAGAALLERFDLDPGVPVRKMSRGMRQKLGIVLTLVHEPRLLVLDEPTSGLDPLMQDELARCLRERARQGATVFFSSHTLSEVEQLCDRVAIVRQGWLVADERLDAMRRRARREVMLRFRDAESAEPLAPPDCLHVEHREGAVWRCTMDGAAGPLIAWAAGQPVEDLTVGPPDLETLFRQFYDAAGEAAD